MLQINDLNIAINNKILLSNISFHLKQNDTLFILGKNGTGKTTLLNNIWAPKEQNKILINNQDFYNINLREKHKYISFFEQYYLFNTPIYTNEILVHKEKNEELYTKLKIAQLLNIEINTLSGGEKQRFMLYCILASKSFIYLLDEPFNNLDKYYTETILKYLPNITSIITIHDLNFIRIPNAKIGIIYNYNLIIFENLHTFINSDLFSILYPGVEFVEKNNKFGFIY